MKKLSLGLLSFSLFTSCSNELVNRSPALTSASGIQVGVMRPAVQALDFQVSVGVAPNQAEVCGVKFEEPRYNVNSNDFVVVNQLVKLPVSELKFPVPTRVELADAGNVERVRKAFIANKTVFNYKPSKPILPDIPITKEGLSPKFCQDLRAYHAEFLQKGPASISLAQVEENTALKLAEQKYIGAKMLLKVDERVAYPHKVRLLIVYDDMYESEALELADIKGKLGFNAEAIRISQLPGYNAASPTPADCNGDFYKECYHSWGDQVNGISQLAVPSLKGFHKETKIFQQYSRVSYIPGLIRAYIRMKKKTNPLDGVILIGHDSVIAPFYINTNRHGHSDNGDVVMGHLHTDLFYMYPDLPLTVNTKLNHVQISPFMWSCSNGSNINIRYWCNDNEYRHWPTPALTAYRWAPFIPSSRMFAPKYNFGSSFFQTLDSKAIVPVGRIPTQEKILGHKDDAIADYIDKVRRWHKELPAMKNNSIASHGGSTNDTWIFMLEDTTGFKATYGTNSKVYASEFFVPLSKCPGCVYKNGPDIMNELGDKNRVALLINGHGGHAGVQAPYANGNVASGYSSEYFWGIGGDHVRRNLVSSATHNTLKIWDEDDKLMGHVIANSCELSDFNLDGEIHKLMANLDSNANQRSFAEQMLTMENAGPVNTYLNSDVGWGYSDNQYNQKFMAYVSQAWNNCGTLGDAYRAIAMDITKQSYSGLDWQVYNRQFLGSPLNRIASPPIHCLIDVFNPNEIKNSL